MSPTSLINLDYLIAKTQGISNIIIGLIDGPILINHEYLDKENIKEISSNLSGICTVQKSVACIHGTFIAGILKAKRGSDAPAICPNCTLLIRTVFPEETNSNKSIPATTPKELAKAIIDCIKAGAMIINLSLALANPSTSNERELENALSYAANNGVIIVAAAGNQGIVSSNAITRHPWVIPVVACDNNGKTLHISNLGSSIGRQGLSAPGKDIISLNANNKSVAFSGTSVAVPFVTGTIALLWSEFPKLSASEIKRAINIVNNRKSIVPPLLNATTSFTYLNTLFYKQKAVA